MEYDYDYSPPEMKVVSLKDAIRYVYECWWREEEKEEERWIKKNCYSIEYVWGIKKEKGGKR